MSRRSRPREDKVEMEGIANAKILRHEGCQHVPKKQKESHCGWNIVNKRVEGDIGAVVRDQVTKPQPAFLVKIL